MWGWGDGREEREGLGGDGRIRGAEVRRGECEGCLMWSSKGKRGRGRAEEGDGESRIQGVCFCRGEEGERRKER